MISSHPSLESELGTAVARGLISQALADVSILARYKDIDQAKKQAIEARHCARIHRHILEQIRIRIRDVARQNIRAKAPKNVMLAACHEINRSQNLREEEVTAIVVEEVWLSLPDTPRRRHGR